MFTIFIYSIWYYQICNKHYFICSQVEIMMFPSIQQELQNFYRNIWIPSIFFFFFFFFCWKELFECILKSMFAAIFTKKLSAWQQPRYSFEGDRCLHPLTYTNFFPTWTPRNIYLFILCWTNPHSSCIKQYNCHFMGVDEVFEVMMVLRLLQGHHWGVVMTIFQCQHLLLGSPTSLTSP